MNKPTIVFVHSSDEWYGSDKNLFHLAVETQRRGFQPVVILPTDVPYAGQLSTRLRDAQITVHRIKMGVLRRKYLGISGLAVFGLYLAYGVFMIMSIARKHKTGLIYSNTSAVLSGALAAALLRIPHVWHVREIIVSPRWVAGLLYRFIILMATRVIVNSQAVADQLEASINRVATKVVVIHNGIDPEQFIAGQQLQLRATFGFDDADVIFGVVGRISHRKGQNIFIRAAGILKDEAPHARYCIIGDPLPDDEAWLTNLKALAQRQKLGNHLVFIPFTEKIVPIMQMLDVLVLPSSQPESFGLVAIEAMACELPVIATRHGGPLEIVSEGETGLFFTPEDPNSLAQAMLTLAQDKAKRRAFGQRGRQRVLTHFTSQQTLTRILDVFETV